MLIQLQDTIINLDTIAFAEITFPGPDSENDWIELRLIIAGSTQILYGDSALTLWDLLRRNAVSIPVGNRDEAELNAYTAVSILAQSAQLPRRQSFG